MLRIATLLLVLIAPAITLAADREQQEEAFRQTLRQLDSASRSHVIESAPSYGPMEMLLMNQMLYGMNQGFQQMQAPVSSRHQYVQPLPSFAPPIRCTSSTALGTTFTNCF